MEVSALISVVTSKLWQQPPPPSPPPPGRAYPGIRPFFVLRERGIFERVALRWVEFQPANSQKFKYLGDDIEVSN